MERKIRFVTTLVREQVLDVAQVQEQADQLLENVLEGLSGTTDEGVEEGLGKVVGVVQDELGGDDSYGYHKDEKRRVYSLPGFDGAYARYRTAQKESLSRVEAAVQLLLQQFVAEAKAARQALMAEVEAADCKTGGLPLFSGWAVIRDMGSSDEQKEVTEDDFRVPDLSEGVMICGHIYASGAHPDGTFIATSVLLKSDGHKFTTLNGSEYALGQPDESYLEFLASQRWSLDEDNPLENELDVEEDEEEEDDDDN